MVKYTVHGKTKSIVGNVIYIYTVRILYFCQIYDRNILHPIRIRLDIIQAIRSSKYIKSLKKCIDVSTI